MNTVGQILLVGKNETHLGYRWERNCFVIDAEPQVMSLARKLFDHGKTAVVAGKHTHRVVSLPLSNSNAKDLHWFLDRFPMTAEPGVLQAIESMAAEYDAVIQSLELADADTSAHYTPEHAVPAVPLRDHQNQFVNMQRQVKRLLLADKLGLGKTISALGLLSDPTYRPALIVTPPSLCLQWQREVKRVYPGFEAVIANGITPYDLKPHDVLITSYNRIGYWQDQLVPKEYKTLIMDEVQDLRHVGTVKRDTAVALSKAAVNVAALSGTPVYNYGDESWSIMDVIKPGCLGSRSDFISEWCVDERKVKEPEVLNRLLRSQGLLLRRTPEDVGLKFTGIEKQVITIDADLESLRKMQDTMKALALSLLSNSFGSGGSDRAAQEFDWKLRMATGTAKAKPVAELVKMIAGEGEKVLLTGWHREVYEIWKTELKDLNPVLITGTETPTQKQKNVDKFIKDESCRLIIFSHVSGAGIDGIQHVCNTVVHGELAWSGRIMDQLNGRVDRDGQTRPCRAYYPVITDGSDPVLLGILSDKNAQHLGIVEGKSSESELLEAAGGASEERVRDMAKQYLTSLGEDIPEPIQEEGALKAVTDVLRRTKVTANDEAGIQADLERILPEALAGLKVVPQYPVSKRSRLDFLVEGDGQRVAIEIKQDSKKRADVYRQVRRYVEEANVTAVVLFAPWFGISSFKVDGVPVVVISYNEKDL